MCSVNLVDFINIDLQIEAQLELGRLLAWKSVNIKIPTTAFPKGLSFIKGELNGNNLFNIYWMLATQKAYS